MNIILVLSDAGEASTLSKGFSALGCSITAIGASGTEAIALCCDLHPDVIIMEPFLPYLNCDEIVSILERKCEHSLVKVAISDQRNDAMAERFMAAGGDLFLRTPFDFSFTLRRFEDCLNSRKQKDSAVPKPNPDQVVHFVTATIQERMQMPATLNGYLYLQDAICLLMKDDTLLHRLVSDLYPAIARHYGLSDSCVERSIRNAIASTFEQGNIEYLYSRFSHVISPSTGKPPNGKFISVLAKLVKEELPY